MNFTFSKRAALAPSTILEWFFQKEKLLELYAHVGIQDIAWISEDTSTGTGQFTRILRINPRPMLPPFVLGLAKTFLYDEHSSYNPLRKEIDLKIVPTAPPLLFQANLKIGLTGDESLKQSQLLFTGEINIDVPLMAGMIEKKIIKELQIKMEEIFSWMGDVENKGSVLPG